MAVARERRPGERGRRRGAARQRHLAGARAREAARIARGAERVDDAIDHRLRHQPVGGELAARDRDEPRGGAEHLLLARHGGGRHRRLAARRDQRPEAGERAHHVGGYQARRGEVVVHRVEQVGDVRGLDRRRHVRSAGVVGVRRADQRVRAPRDDEHHPAVGDRAQHDRGAVPDPLVRHHDVHALGEPEARRCLGRVERHHPIDPRPGRIHHHPRPRHHLAAAEPVDDARADDPPALLHEAGDLGVGDDERALGGRGERGLEHEARVVGAAVPVLARAAESVAQERRLGLGDGPGREHVVPAHVPEAGEEVVSP